MAELDKDRWFNKLIPYKLKLLEGAIWACYITMKRPLYGSMPTSIKSAHGIELELEDIHELTHLYFESGLITARWLSLFMGMRIGAPPSNGNRQALTQIERPFIFSLPSRTNPSDVFLTTLGRNLVNEPQAFFEINGFNREEVKQAVWAVLESVDHAIAHPTDGRGDVNFSECGLGFYAIHQLAKTWIYRGGMGYSAPAETLFLNEDRIPANCPPWTRVVPRTQDQR